MRAGSAASSVAAPPGGGDPLGDWLRAVLPLCLDRLPPVPSGRPGGRAAVLVPLVLGDGPPVVLLTVRAPGLRHHAGQVSFPGGRIDPTDADGAAAALREAKEEIGLPPASVRIVGALPPQDTSSGFTVDPVVGLIDGDAPTLRPSPDEVASLLTLPVRHLLDPAYPSRDTVVVRGETRPVLVWPHETHRIWGATAAMLASLADRLRARAAP